METKKSRSLSLFFGGVLMFIGIITLLGNIFYRINFWSYAWPLLVMAGGGVFFAFMASGGKDSAPLAIPGTIIGGIGLMMFLQNLTDHWESWAYGWTVIIMLVGLGIFIMGVWGERPEQKKSGLGVLKVGAILFVIFGSFFELLFSGRSFFGYLFPTLLILLGLYLVIRRVTPVKVATAVQEAPKAVEEAPLVEEAAAAGENLK